MFPLGLGAGWTTTTAITATITARASVWKFNRGRSANVRIPEPLELLVRASIISQVISDVGIVRPRNGSPRGMLVIGILLCLPYQKFLPCLSTVYDFLSVLALAMAEVSSLVTGAFQIHSHSQMPESIDKRKIPQLSLSRPRRGRRGGQEWGFSWTGGLVNWWAGEPVDESTGHQTNQPPTYPPTNSERERKGVFGRGRHAARQGLNHSGPFPCNSRTMTCCVVCVYINNLHL